MFYLPLKFLEILIGMLGRMVRIAPVSKTRNHTKERQTNTFKISLTISELPMA